MSFGAKIIKKPRITIADSHQPEKKNSSGLITNFENETSFRIQDNSPIPHYYCASGFQIASSRMFKLVKTITAPTF